MTGTNDHLVNPSNSFYLKEMLNPVDFVVFEGAGHQINVECSEAYNEALVKHFKRNSSTEKMM